jgi:tetratricopeptide (TPR) repeat protein
VGRRDELGRFAAALRELAAAGGPRRGRWPVRRPPAGEAVGAAGSRVVLVHGLGGSGKSSLLRQFRTMAQGEVADSPVAAGWVRTGWLDWEDEAGQDPGRYAGAAGPSLVTVLDAVQRTVTGAFAGDERAAGRVAQAFEEYRAGAARMPEYLARFGEVVAQAGRPGSAFTSQDAAALVRAAASAGLVAAGHPGGVLGLGPDELAAAAQAGGHLSEAAVQAVTGRKPGEITPQEYDLVTDPARELTRRAAAAVRAAAGTRPLVMFLDTGEVIGDRAWGWLRRMMTGTGPRVAWVAGARFETEAEAGPDSPVARFVREIGDEHLLLMSPTRFDDTMISAYLQSRPGARSLTGEQIDLIARFTRGLPLAVSFTATLLDGGQSPEQACRDIDDGHPSTVISQLARRYLVHAESRDTQDAYPPGDPRRGDVTKILALALAYGNLREDPDLLAALWDTSDPLATFQDLARRHDFVLPASRRLHDDVRDTLRTDLLDPYRRLRARPVNERALALFTTRLTRLRDRWPTLDDQLGHAEFTTSLLGALWHASWISNQDGLDLLTAILPVLAAADPRTADAAAAITGQFAGTYTPDQQHELDQLTADRLSRLAGLPGDLPPGRRGRAIRQARITREGLDMHRPGQTGDQPLLGQPGDRSAAVLILRAGLQAADRQDGAAVASLQAAATQIGSTRLGQAIGARALAIADRLIWAGPRRTSVPTDTGLAAARIATEMLPGSAAAWRSYGPALDNAGRHKEALAAYDQALALDPGNAHVHNNRGVALRNMGRLEEALAAFDQALALDLDTFRVHNNRGVALRALGRPEEALAAFDQALAREPDDAHIHNSRGNTLRTLGRLEEALAAYDQAVALDPDNAYVHENRGIFLAVGGDLDAALADFDSADRLNPAGSGESRTWAGAILWHRREAAAARDRFARVGRRVTGCTPFLTAEMEAIALCGLGQPDTAEQHLLSAMPHRAAGDRAEPRTIYDLLADPPLPGIDRLRAIIDNDNI